MKRKIFIISCFFLFLPLFSFAQDVLGGEAQELKAIAEQEGKFFIAHTKISINNVYLNGLNYIETKISPFFKISHFYLALDFPMRIGTDHGGILNAWTYIYPANYLQFIHSFGYETPSHSFDLHVGTITDLTWGEGLLLSHFRNDLFLPDIRQLGVLMHLQPNRYFSLELFGSNIENFGFGGISLRTFPLVALSSSSPLSKMELSASFMYDIDTQHILYRSPDVINWAINPQSSQRYAYSVSTRLPIGERDNIQGKEKTMQWGFSFEHAGIVTASEYAIIGKFFLQYDFYTLHLGLGYLNNGFRLGYFSALYFQPSRRADSSTPRRQDALGYTWENEFSFFQSLLTFHLDIYGQTTPIFSIHAGFELKPYLLKQLSCMLAYILENGDSLQDFVPSKKTPKTFILAKVAYQFGDRATLGFLYRRALHVENNTKISPSNEISVQVGIIF